MNVLELIVAFWLGRATKGAGLLVVMASCFLTLALIGLVVGVAMAAWHFSPQAAQVVQWSGIGAYLPFLEFRVHHAGVPGVGAIIAELPSRIALCIVALGVISVLLTAAFGLLNMAISVAVKAVKLRRHNART